MSENGQTPPSARGREGVVSLDADTCYRALCARDGRFDGVFFVAVKTTGIYCRPVCRARTPAPDRCVFYRTPVEAERDGFRACFRCRPELAPGNGPVDSVPRLVEQAVARIDAGFLNEGSLDELAEALGVTGRHLRRAIRTELGVSPVALAQSRRLALAKQLLQDTALPLAEVAFASGFASVRRFNALFQARFGRPPSALRREHAADGAPAALVLRLDYRAPLDWDALLGFLAGRAIPGAEEVATGIYRRTVRLAGASGWIEVQRDPSPQETLRATVSLSLASVLMQVVARLRGLFDLDAHPAAICAHLARDPALAPLLERHPGLRVPGAFDGFETAVRGILGQQVSVRAATTLSGRLIERFGEPLETPHPGLRRLFPRPDVLARASEDDVAGLGMPGARARTVIALARAVAGSELRLDRVGRAGPTDVVRERLQALPGVGDWTAQYIAMRVLGWPDAFPASDLGLRHALGGLSAREIERQAEPWRPWRAYAAMHLWTSLTPAVSRRSDRETPPATGGQGR
ncbi:MAG TPA: AlkA N-terminal domain-containing protein [Polyangia bacterium]|jgi:AraC family transcriptional regulator of adaptative response / DNA-3-methyladenine glycosylase II|nr:AlkA N-terminal domain-containing protein [Polyangia bacterium]